MKPLIKHILQELEKAYPCHLAEHWDNVGLLVGNRGAEVSRILLALDTSERLVQEALDLGADTIITHHPVIFKPLSAITTEEPGGRILQKALAHGINIIACHTNLDSAIEGVNDALVTALDLTDVEPLVSAAGFDEAGLGRIGILREELSFDTLLGKLFDILDLENFNIAGPQPEKVGRIALCGGSGSDFARLAYSKKADVYLSSEIKHDVAVWANDAGFCIIDGTHYATEKPGVYQLQRFLKKTSAANNWKTEIIMTETERHPFVTVHKINDKIKNNHKD